MYDAGTVVWVQFPGAQKTKQRPAVILSSQTYHAQRPDVIIGIVTSQISKAKTSSDRILADWQSAGLRQASAFRTFLATVPQLSIINPLGRLSDADWAVVQACVSGAVAIK
jgi:mRNA interferase MazF